MTKRLSIASALLTLLSALLALLLLSAPAFAHHKGDHEQGQGQQTTSDAGDRDGDADSDANTAYTEDNDTNDGNTPNNVSDDGDNAHPSGKDRSVENGNSGTQGKSESNPDDTNGPMRYEGQPGDDKANGPGGTDLADQDGNNGCGNDDDFDDDNNGWCGKPEETTPPVVAGTSTTSCPTPMTYPSHGCGTISEPAPTVVLGDTIKNDDATVLGGTIEAEGKDEVAAAATRQPRGAALPFTGGNVVLFLVIAMGLLGVGVALLRTRRS